MTKVKIYTTKTCSWCARAKEFFDSKGVEYLELDVSTNERARNVLIKKTGSIKVPVIEINGITIIGFEVNALENALKMT